MRQKWDNLVTWVKRESLYEDKFVSTTEGPRRFEGLWRFYGYQPFGCNYHKNCQPYYEALTFEKLDEEGQPIYAKKQQLREYLNQIKSLSQCSPSITN